MKYLTKPQLDLYLRHLACHRAHSYPLLIELIARSGCRTHECVQLTSASIDLHQSTIAIKACKGSDDRSVPIDRAFLTVLAETLRHYTSVSSMFDTMSIASLKRKLRDAHARSLLACFGPGGPTCSLHGLRASFAMSMYLGLDYDVLLVKQLLGHRNINSTMYYVHAVNMDSRKADILRVMRPAKTKP